MRHLFVTEPLPIPVGYVPLARAMLCCDCEAIFPVGPTCPNCAGEHMIPLARGLSTVKPVAEARPERSQSDPLDCPTPYPWCYGFPTQAACITAGYCRRTPSCGD